jgi:hypothetical protein
MRLMETPWLRELVAPHLPPCVSIYLPMHRAKPPAAENPRLYRDLVDEAERSLSRDYRGRDVHEIVSKLRSVPPDDGFWVGPRDAIAVFASPELVRVVDIQQPMEPAVYVADRFRIKPLIRVLQQDWKYHLLALSQRQARMYLGSGPSVLEPLDSQSIPQSPDVVSKMRLRHDIPANDDLRTPDTQFPDEGTLAAPTSLENFMRAVDKAVWENFSRDANLPVILCAVEHYHPLFCALSKNPQLLVEGIDHDPQEMPLERLREQAWAILEPKYRAHVEDLKNQFMAAKAHQKGSDELVPVVEAAVVGRVDTLLVDGAHQIPGLLDPTSGQIRQADRDDPRANDLLDDLAEMVLKAEGEVLVLPPEMMPGEVALAAIYRY